MSNLLERARRTCLSLPEAQEVEAWSEPTFRVGKKIFAKFAGAGHHPAAGADALWCKAPTGLQEHLVREAPETYFVPPYVGVKGWIGIRLNAVDDATLRGHVVESYCMIAPKKLQALVE